MKIIKWLIYLMALIVATVPIFLNFQLDQYGIIDYLIKYWEFYLIAAGFFTVGKLVGWLWN
jgi:hypothetical protein